MSINDLDIHTLAAFNTPMFYSNSQDSHYKNLLYIATSSATSKPNLPKLVFQRAADEKMNGLPSDIPSTFIGVRYVHYFDENNIMIELKTITGAGGLHPIYFNSYNGSTWTGWTKLTPTAVS